MTTSSQPPAAVHYHQLIDDHDHIDRLTEQLERLLDRASPADATTAAEAERLLGVLARVVADHLATEDSFIYPALVGSDDPAGADGLIRDFEVLKADWGGFLMTWGPGRAQADWPGFRIAARGMLDRLRDRVMKETALLYSMALREGLIRLRPTA